MISLTTTLERIMKKSKSIGVRQIARELKLSPSHVSRVINGERQSRRLAAELKKRGIKVKGAK